MLSKVVVAINLEVGLIKSYNEFKIIDGIPIYHTLLGRPWIYLHQCVSSTLHHCVRFNYIGRDIEMHATKASFEATEAYLINAHLFEDVASLGLSNIRKEENLRLCLGKGYNEEEIHRSKWPRVEKKTTEIEIIMKEARKAIQKHQLPHEKLVWEILEEVVGLAEIKAIASVDHP